MIAAPQTTADAMPDNDDSKEKLGIACPTCGCRHLSVGYTRPGYKIRVRIRNCRHCGRRIVTHEKIVGESDDENEET